MKRKKIDIKTIGFTIFTWGVIISGINLLCGFVVRNTYIAVDPINEETARTSYGYFAPNQDKVILFPGNPPYKVNIDAMGLRSVGLDKDLSVEDIEDRYKILALGDSVTFGLFVDDEDSFPFRLQEIVKERQHNTVVLNAGVGSATISDYLYYLNLKGLSLKPDLVTINFCSNDLAELSRTTPLYQKMKEENIFSFFKTFKLTKFMRIFRKAELARRFKRSTNRIQDERVKNALLNESKDLEDILYVSGFLGGLAVTDSRNKELEESWERYFESLDQIINLLRKEKIDLVYIIHPDIVTVYGRSKSNYQDILREFLDERNVEYVDPLPVFKKLKDQHLNIYNNLPRDFHLSGLGNQIVAEQIYKKVRHRIN